MINRIEELHRALKITYINLMRLRRDSSKIAGMKSSEAIVLNAIDRLSKLNSSFVKSSELSKELDLSPPTITKLLNDLEKKKYIERNIDLNNRRNIQICLTEKSVSIIEEINKIYDEYFNGLINLYGEEGVKKFIFDLNKMITYTNDFYRKT
jgi:DNA-binding MarR family transcriptional regulator